MHEALEEPPRRPCDSSHGCLVAHLCCHRLYRALRGLAAREFGSGSSLSAVGQEFWNVGDGLGCCGSHDSVLTKRPFRFRRNCALHSRYLPLLRSPSFPSLETTASFTSRNSSISSDLERGFMT